MPDVYIYTIPQPLRVQVIHIWRDTLGNESQYLGDESQYRAHDQKTIQAYKFIVETLCREYGLFRLPGSGDAQNRDTFLSELANFVLKEQDSEKVLDAIELSFRCIAKIIRRDHERSDCVAVADNAIAELNERFREHGVGYEYDGGYIIRIDSQLLHAETVKPTLSLLRNTPEYAGAQVEFLTAHEHYRNGRPKEALTDCLKALESVMKAICAKRGWTCDPNATATGLLKVMFEKGLILLFWPQHFSALRSILESGVPTGRNKLGGTVKALKLSKCPNILSRTYFISPPQRSFFLRRLRRHCHELRGDHNDT